MDTKTFIEKSKQIFGNKFDYSNTDFVGWREKICITCPKHGDILLLPGNHIHGQKQGCTKCNCESRLLDKFIEVHGNKYDYSKMVYVDSFTKICIVCPEHGEFWQTPKDHASGSGCKKCAGNYKKCLEEFIEESKQIYNDLFDYSKTKYNGAHKKCTFICKKHDYEFEQTPDNHLRWNGCPFCHSHSKLEDDIRILLRENNVFYEEQKTFDWLKYKNNMYLDFFIPGTNIAIECQGEQHFMNFRFEKNNIDKLKFRIERDKEKLKLCREHGIRIIYFSNLKKYKFCCGEEMFFDKNKILNEIKNEGY